MRLLVAHGKDHRDGHAYVEATEGIILQLFDPALTNSALAPPPQLCIYLSSMVLQQRQTSSVPHPASNPPLTHTAPAQ